MKSVPKGTEKDNGWEDSDWLKHTVLGIPKAEKRPETDSADMVTATLSGFNRPDKLLLKVQIQI